MGATSSWSRQTSPRTLSRGVRERQADSRPISRSSTASRCDGEHVFLPGHRVMVQVQSSWFPLYDRNPQTFVRAFFRATPGDYRKAIQRIYTHRPRELHRPAGRDDAVTTTFGGV